MARAGRLATGFAAAAAGATACACAPELARVVDARLGATDAAAACAHAPPLAPQRAALRTLYPPSAPRVRAHVRSRDGRFDLYYEEAGSAAGRPALFVHGGPGASFPADAHRLFDPAAYRIVCVEQRGSARSISAPRSARVGGGGGGGGAADGPAVGEAFVPSTTWEHVQDLEAVREHLGVRAWHVVHGGSWGGTLALAYAQAEPARVRGLVLRGASPWEPRDVRWVYEGDGPAAFYPREHEAYRAELPRGARAAGAVAWLHCALCGRGAAAAAAAGATAAPAEAHAACGAGAAPWAERVRLARALLRWEALLASLEPPAPQGAQAGRVTAGAGAGAGRARARFAPDGASAGAKADGGAGWGLATPPPSALPLESCAPAPAGRAALDEARAASDAAGDAHAVAVGAAAAHYAAHGAFLPRPRALLEGCAVLRAAGTARRTVLVHGRYDLVCPPSRAWALHRALPGSRLELAVGGHAGTDPAVLDAVVRALDALAAEDGVASDAGGDASAPDGGCPDSGAVGFTV